MSQSPVIAALQCEFLSSKGTQERKEYLWTAAIRTTATQYSEPQGSSGYEKTQDTGPLVAEIHMKEMLSVSPRLLHLPIYRKVLNSLTWDIWLPLINNNLLMFRLPVLCCKTSV